MLEDSLDNDKKQKALNLFKGTLLAIVAFLLPQLLIVVIAPLVVGLVEDTNVRIFVLQALVQSISILLIWLFIRKSKIDFRKFVGLNKTRISDMLFAVVVFPLYAGISILFMSLLSSIFPIDTMQEQAIGFSSSTMPGLALIFVALVIITPLAEEILFRGFLLKLYSDNLNPILSAVLVSLLFAVAHGQLNVALDTFILSLFLCYLRITTKSLWPSILLHSVKNFVAFYILFIIGVK